MRLDDFENYVDPEILKRGYDYYRDGRILELVEMENNRFRATVSGTYRYIVTVETRDGYILSSHCDCPYNQGEFCKHEVAVFYELSKRFCSDKTSPSSHRKTITEKLSEIYEQVSRDELIQFLDLLVSQNRSIRNLFLTYFSDYIEEDRHKKYRHLVREAINSGKDRHGFIDYNRSFRVTEQINALLQKAEEFITEENFTTAFTIASSVIEKLTPALHYMDSSSGGPGDCISWAFSIIERVAQLTPSREFQDQIFNYLLKEFKTGQVQRLWF